MTDELLTLDDIAAIYKLSRDHVRDCVVKMPGFPDLAPGSSRRSPRWLRSEVRAFLYRKTARIPQTQLQAA